MTPSTAPSIGWELYRSFLGVLQEGSLSAAARTLGITQPTVGRHIEALERALKLTLFIRSQTGLVPTEAARSLQSYAEQMANTASTLARVAASQGEGVRGVVRVTASEVVGVEVLPPIIATLRATAPDLQLEVVLSDVPQDLLHREADIAIRMFAPRQAQLIAVKLGEVEVGLHATAAYLEAKGEPATVSDLVNHTLVGFDTYTDFVRRNLKMLPPQFQREHCALRSDSDLAQLAMVRAGCGIGACQLPLAARSPGLVRVLADVFLFRMEVWVTMHQDLRNSQPHRAVFDGLRAGLRDYIG